MNSDFIDSKKETVNCKGVNFGNLSILFLLYLTGYWATWLPIVLYCAEWAKDGLFIVGSLLDASDKSCLNNNWKCL